MPQPKPRVLIERILLGAAAVCLIAGVWALVFPEDVGEENRALFIAAGSSGLFGCLMGLLMVRIIILFQRSRTSRKVLSDWQKKLASGERPVIDSAHQLSEGALRILAMQLFSRIGYGILNRDEDVGYVRMLNPQGKLELVACRQQSAPLELEPVFEFDKDIKRDGAVQGHFWAAGGFTSEACDWASQRSILLADRQGIGQFIDSVIAHRSALLE
jgi:hypothetical protein